MQKMVIEREFEWATADGKAPLSRPLCGFSGDECPLDFTCTPPIGPVDES